MTPADLERVREHHSLCWGDRCTGWTTFEFDDNGDLYWDEQPEVICPCECHPPEYIAAAMRRKAVAVLAAHDEAGGTGQ